MGDEDYGDDRLREAMMRERERQQLNQSTRTAALGGGASGAVMGAVTGIMGGKRKLADILKAAATSGLLSGGFAGGATYLGGKALGAPDEDDPSANTHRGALGGAIGGGLAGAGLGALISSGKMKVPKIAGLTDNLIIDKLKGLVGKAHGTKMGAGLMGALGAGGVGYLGADEGMQLDFLANEMKKARKRRAASSMEPME